MGSLRLASRGPLRSSPSVMLGRARFGLRAILSLAVAVTLSSTSLGCSSGSDGAQGPTTADPEAPPARPTSAPLVLELGDVPAGRETTFELPEGILGFTLVARGAPWTKLSTLRNANGAIVEGETLLGCSEATDSVSASSAFAVQIPSRGPGLDAAHVPSGTWSFVLRDPAQVRIIAQRTSDGRFHGGLLDLQIYLPEGLVVDREPIGAAPASASELPAGIRRRITHLDAFVQKLYGVSIGTITVHDVPGEFRHIVASPEVSGAERSGALMRESAKGAASQGLHLFFVETSNIYWGLSGGLPGAPLTTGTDASGVILAVKASPSPAEDEATAERDASAIVHEIGHFVGLPHTTIMAGRTDCLDDTPACDDLTPERRDACPDRSNLMFFAGGGTLASTVISPKQQRVFRGSPLYRAYTTEE